MFEYSTQIVVPFHDIDIMNVVWHGNYPKYFEIARTGLMQQLELDWPSLKEILVAMPVVDLKVKYIRGIEYNSTVNVVASIDEFKYPELVINYKIMNEDGGLLTTAETRQVYFSIDQECVLFTVPKQVLGKFESYVN